MRLIEINSFLARKCYRNEITVVQYRKMIKLFKERNIVLKVINNV